MPVKMQAAHHDPELHGVVVEVDDATGKATAIRRVEKIG
jgi:calcineurin-like phosphoesterase